MVKITNAFLREGENGQFTALELQGELEMVQSSNSGRFYATVRKCTIPSTLTLEEAVRFIGKQIPGSVQRVECEPYEYTIESTGEVIQLSHRWEYVPDASSETGAPVIEMSVGRLSA